MSCNAALAAELGDKKSFDVGFMIDIDAISLAKIPSKFSNTACEAFRPVGQGLSMVVMVLTLDTGQSRVFLSPLLTVSRARQLPSHRFPTHVAVPGSHSTERGSHVIDDPS